MLHVFAKSQSLQDGWLTAIPLPQLFAERCSRRPLSPTRHLSQLTPQPVLIEENVWVGFEAKLSGIVTIGRGPSWLSKLGEDVPLYLRCGEIPCSVIRFLEPTDTEETGAERV